MDIIPYRAAFPVNDVLYKKAGTIRRNPYGYLKKRSLIYPIERMYVVEKSLKYAEDWVNDFASSIRECINLPFGATYGDNPWYVFYAPNGAKVRFCAQLAYTELQLYDALSNQGGSPPTYFIQPTQEYIRFWAAPMIWSKYGGNIEAPAYSCGNPMVFRDSDNYVRKTIGRHRYMYDIGPKGFGYGYYERPFRANIYGQGIQEFPELEILNIYRGPPHGNLLNLDITFNVPSPGPYFEKYLALSTGSSYDNTEINRWKNGDYIPVVEVGMDFNILMPFNNYLPLIPNVNAKTKDTIYWLYDIQVYVDDVLLADHWRVGLDTWGNDFVYHIDGRFSLPSSGVPNDYLFPLQKVTCDRKWISNGFKESPWERYPTLL